MKLELNPNKVYGLVLKDGRRQDIAFFGEELETNSMSQYYLYHIANNRKPSTLVVTTVNRVNFLFDGRTISPVFNGNYEPSVVFTRRLDETTLKDERVSRLLSKMRAAGLREIPS